MRGKKLRGHQVGHVIVNRRSDEDDVVFQQPGINIVSAFAAVRLLDDHGNQGCCTRIRVVCLSHWKIFSR